jgi:hypothetical protein
VADNAFHTKGDLFGGLRFLVEDRFRLTAESSLFPIVTPLSLCVVGSLSSLVLGHAVLCMLPAVLVRTESLSRLGNDNLRALHP